MSLSTLLDSVHTPRKGKKRSSVWLHFKDLGDEKARCHYCQKILSFKGGTTYNLNRHLFKAHPSLSNETLVTEDSIEFQNEEEPFTSEGKKLDPWIHFTDLGENKTKCNWCSKIMSYKTNETTNLIKHLILQHPDVEFTPVEEKQSILEEKPDVSRSIKVNNTHTKRSCVWLYFTVVERHKARCDYCKSIVNCSSGSTSNLVRHLRAKHNFSTKFKGDDQTLKLIPPTDVNVNEKPQITHTSNLNPKAREINVNLVEALMRNYIPYEIVEDTYFRKFVNKLNPSYTLPSIKVLAEGIIPRLNEAIRERLRKALDTAPAVSFSIETWKSVLNENFLTLSVHYINEECLMQNHVLECFEFADTCTSDDLAHEFRRIVIEWSLEGKVVAGVTDGTDLLLNAVEATGWAHLACFAHNLNWIVQNALQEIKDVYCKVKEIVEFFLLNAEASERLRVTQEQMGVLLLSPKDDSMGTWNSTYDMLHRFCELRCAMLETALGSYPDMEMLNEDENQIVVLACDVLKVFRDVGEEISSVKQVSASKIILLTQALRNWTASFLTDRVLPEEVHSFCTKLQEGINSQFSSLEEHSVYAESTFLDPRFKHCGFTDRKCLETVKQTLAERIGATSTSVKSEMCDDVLNVSTVWKDFDITVRNIVEGPNAGAKLEIEKYLEEPLLPRQRDLLVWWEARKTVYPNLFLLAKRSLCVVATSSPCDLLFSEAGQQTIRHRNCLSGAKVPQIMFLHGNL